MFNVAKKPSPGVPIRSHWRRAKFPARPGGAVLVSIDDTVVLVPWLVPRKPRRAGIFPLTVDYIGRPTPPARFPVVSSSAKAVLPRRKR